MTLATTWPWRWSASAWAALTFLVFAAAALYARRQAIEARRLREQQARPFVLIDFHAHQTVIELVVTNAGATVARDVRFEFDRPPVSAYELEPGGRRKVAEVTMIKNGIPSLAPQKEMRLFFDQFPARAAADLPLTYYVTVSYRDHAGHEYVEEQVLDLQVYLGTGGIHRDGLHEVHRELKVISEQIKRWTDSSGLRIVTQADIDRRYADWEREDADGETAVEPSEDSSAEAEGGGETPEAHSPR